MDYVALAPICGAITGVSAAYVVRMYRRLQELTARVAVLEEDVNFLFDIDPDDPDEGEVERPPNNVVAIGRR